MTEETTRSLRDLVAEVSIAYFENSHVSVSEIRIVISEIAQSLGAVGEPQQGASEPVERRSRQRLTPAQIRNSVTPDQIFSFEDGKGYKTLRRHLSGRNLSPEEYREKWGLPPDYPMVTLNYSTMRAQIAKQSGLGARGRVAATAAARSRSRRPA